MALVIPNVESTPTFLAQAYGDETDRLAELAAIVGTGVISGCQVTTTPAHTTKVKVAAGIIAFNGIQVAVATQSIAVTTFTPTHDRRDIVTIGPTGTASVTKGTACTLATWKPTTTHNPTGKNPPVKPAVPSTHVLVGEFYMAHATTSANMTSGNIIDKTTIINAPLAQSTVIQLGTI